jgi:hypothetical protein
LTNLGSLSHREQQVPEQPQKQQLPHYVRLVAVEDEAQDLSRIHYPDSTAAIVAHRY